MQEGPTGLTLARAYELGVGHPWTLGEYSFGLVYAIASSAHDWLVEHTKYLELGMRLARSKLKPVDQSKVGAQPNVTPCDCCGVLMDPEATNCPKCNAKYEIASNDVQCTKASTPLYNPDGYNLVENGWDFVGSHSTRPSKPNAPLFDIYFRENSKGHSEVATVHQDQVGFHEIAHLRVHWEGVQDIHARWIARLPKRGTKKPPVWLDELHLTSLKCAAGDGWDFVGFYRVLNDHTESEVFVRGEETHYQVSLIQKPDSGLEEVQVFNSKDIKCLPIIRSIHARWWNRKSAHLKTLEETKAKAIALELESKPTSRL